MSLFNKVKKSIWQLVFHKAKLSFSQSGEDLILDTIFINLQKGTYLDVGANNPFLQSNTSYFYKKGWRGINIDAMPGSMKVFESARSGDKNLEVAIGSEEIELTYHMFDNSLYNTFDGSKINEVKKYSGYKGSKKIKTVTLASVLENLKVYDIDFFTLDVEGHDLEVLKSNDWNKVRPKVILVEYFFTNIDSLKADEIYKFLESKGYSFFCNTPTNAFYLEKKYLETRFSK